MKKNILPVVFCLGLVTSFNLTFAETNTSLEAMISKGLANNLELRQAKLALDSAHDSLKQQQRLVSITGNADLSYTQAAENSTKTNNFGVSLLTGGTPDPAKATWSLSLNHLQDELLENSGDTYALKYTPFNLNQNLTRLTTKLNLINTETIYQSTRITTISKIRLLYAACYQKSMLLKLSQEDLRLMQEHLKQTNSLYKAGKIAHLELQTVVQEEQSSINQLQIAKLNYQAALTRLGFAIGEPDLNLEQITPDSLNWASSNQIDLNATLAKLKTVSPEIIAVQVEVDLAKLRLKQASLCQLSRLELGVAHHQPKVSTTSSPTTTYSVGISGSLDDLVWKNISQEKKALTSNTAKLELTITTTTTKLLESFQTWQIAELSLQPHKEALQLAKERLRVTSLKFEHGMVASSEVLQAQQALTTAETNYWQTWLELNQARESFYESCWGNPILK